jgi:hypothetical protein
MNVKSSLLVLAAFVGGACGAPDATGDSNPGGFGNERADDGTVVRPSQIKDLGVLQENVVVDEDYTGHPRYLGAKIQARKGQLIEASASIVADMVPVAAITDAQFRLLARVNGSRANNGNRSFADAQAVASTDGTYWVLFGQAERMPTHIEVNFSIFRNAGTDCREDFECMSQSCMEAICAPSHPGQLCALDTDCTSGNCREDNTCGFLADGSVCERSSECEHNLCTDGVCSCLPAGASSGDAGQCCSQSVTATANGVVCD